MTAVGRISILLWIVGVISLVATGQGLPPGAEPNNPNIFVELLVVAIPNQDAVPIVGQLNNPATSQEGLAKVQEILRRGGAKIIGWPTVTTTSGERAVVEAVNEVRYATEYSAGGVGIYYNKDEGVVKKEEPVVRGADFHAVPSAFETRNTGVTLEIEPRVESNGSTIHLQIVAQHIRLAGMKKIAIEKPNTQEKVVTEQPGFENFRVTTGFAMESGEQKLIGVFPATEPANHLELMILRVEVRKP
jgi:Flp pilus assembly secretin CpaC